MPENTICGLCFLKGMKKEQLKQLILLLQEELAQIILIGDPAEINSHAAKLGLKNLSKATDGQSEIA